MRASCLFLTLILQFISGLAFAGDPSRTTLSFSIGKLSGVYLYPSGTTNTFLGSGFTGGINFPFFNKKSHSLSLSLKYRYVQFENQDVVSPNEDYMLVQGPGLGLSYRFHFVYIGYDYFFTRAQNIVVGNNAGVRDYDLNISSPWIGFMWAPKKLGFMLMYSYGSGSCMPGGYSNNKTLTYSESYLALNLVYFLKDPPGATIRDLY